MYHLSLYIGRIYIYIYVFNVKKINILNILINSEFWIDSLKYELTHWNESNLQTLKSQISSEY